MDDLDRLYRRLIQNIRTHQPEYLHIPFTVQELYEQLVPYRHNRRELAIETNQDYEIAVARLLSGERGYLESDPGMQNALKQELGSPNGNPSVFKDHAHTQVSLSASPPTSTRITPVPGAPPVLAPVSGEATSEGTPSPSPTEGSPVPQATAPVASASSTPQPNPYPSAAAAVQAAFDTLAPAAAVPATAQPSSASLLSSLSHIDVPIGCRFCGGTLPEDREVNYCPHCGENLKTQRCPACGAEMDTSWKFCVTCGRRTT